MIAGTIEKIVIRALFELSKNSDPPFKVEEVREHLNQHVENGAIRSYSFQDSEVESGLEKAMRMGFVEKIFSSWSLSIAGKRVAPGIHWTHLE